ncbi:hypothetical protein [Paraburkholderia sp. C35]|uniref:hypothetical protein n=1 Tax=Paraburkholderia sp. C35 TaxID=2126993 RepID=UPI000D694C6D|nr:hypothetical protein [Paraburkholderia sp. C35]
MSRKKSEVSLKDKQKPDSEPKEGRPEMPSGILSFKQFQQLAMQEAERGRNESQLAQFVERKRWWLKNVGGLYRKIDVWLKPLIDADAVKTTSGEMEISEKYIGAYQATTLRIKIGGSVVKLLPRGTFILGAFGRIDLEGVYGQTERLILDSNEPENTPFNLRKDGEWKLGVPGQPTVNLAPLDRENFVSLLATLANLS